jgi:hypothetical protein
VARLEGHLNKDVDLAWGILAKLNKGGWIIIEQADIGQHQWHIVHFKMAMTGRIFFSTKVFDTTEDETRFAPLPTNLSYKQAIQIVESEGAAGGQETTKTQANQ